MIYTCIVCDKEFKGRPYRPSKYCSMECRNADWHNAHAEQIARVSQQKKETEELKQRRKMMRKLNSILKRRMKQLEPKQMHECRCEECAVVFLSERRVKYCSDACRHRHTNRAKEERIYKNGKPDLSISLTKLYMRDMGVCALCGKHIDFDCDSNSAHYPSIDHIIPLSKGGLHSWDNVQLACRECNMRKSNKM